MYVYMEIGDAYVNCVCVLVQFQLDDAIEKEDFEEAVKLNRALSEATSKDTVAEIMDQLKARAAQFV